MSDEAEGWHLTDHACRHCLGRVIERGRIFKCSTCGASTPGPRPFLICGCGIEARGAQRPRRSGFMCGPNPRQEPSNPAEIVILFDGQPLGTGS